MPAGPSAAASKSRCPATGRAKAEYLHVDLGRFNCGLNCGVAPTDNVSMHDDVVRAGLNYHFGWGK